MFQKRLAVCLAAMILALCLTVSAALAETATVVGGWLILRDAPSYSGIGIASYPSGTVVTITGSDGEWYEVIAPDGRSGYMLARYLRVNESSEPAYTEAEEGEGEGGIQPDTDSHSGGYTAYITSANGLNVRLRSGPGTGYSIIASYAPGTRCTVLSTGGGWSRVRVGSFMGYIMSQFLTTSPTPAPVPIDPGSGYTAWVTSSNGLGVNLRSGPSKNYPSIGYYAVGTAVTVYTPGADWCYISIGSRTGYMMTRYLTTKKPTPVTPVLGAPMVISPNGRNVNLRSGPGKGYAVIGSYAVGTTLEIVLRGTEWYYIRIGGRYGYMMKMYISEPLLTSRMPAQAADLLC